VDQFYRACALAGGSNSLSQVDLGPWVCRCVNALKAYSTLQGSIMGVMLDAREWHLLNRVTAKWWELLSRCERWQLLGIFQSYTSTAYWDVIAINGRLMKATLWVKVVLLIRIWAEMRLLETWQ
jgi:hypothetical protein